MHLNSTIPFPNNEPVLDYTYKSQEREDLKRELDRQRATEIAVPLVIGGERIFTQTTMPLHAPHDHSQVLGTSSRATREHVGMAIEASREAFKMWSKCPKEERAAIFLKAAHLLSTKYRAKMSAAAMLNLSKTVHQAEIDVVAELVDFWNFNCHFMDTIYARQPLYSPEGVWNRLEYRALEGFVFAVTPFNFASIAGNLPTAPALMGNTVIWKPASSAVLIAYYLMELLEEAGLPKGVINFLPGAGHVVGDVVLESPHLAGIHFTGSTRTFNQMWKRVGENLAAGVYRTYPRIVGETGGKGFLLAAPDAEVEPLAVALFRGAFEYQGQKCSAASRAYLPRSLWPEVIESLQKMHATAIMGDVTRFETFMGAVIDEKAFNTITSYIDYAHKTPGHQILMGGGYDRTEGWFVEPTLVQVDDPKGKLMSEEIFGPVLSLYVYDDADLMEVAHLVDETSPYALTGAIFTRNRSTATRLSSVLEHAAGNFYINDKPTGAVVGQQPFGGARASGTNDKAGSETNLMRFTSMRTIKENFTPPTTYPYPSMKKIPQQ